MVAEKVMESSAPHPTPQFNCMWPYLLTFFYLDQKGNQNDELK